MKILLSWLKDYIDINETPEAIAEALTMCGLEVEEVIQPGKNLVNIVVGKILTMEKHPQADSLSLCSVDVNKGSPLQIVCGASNMKAGDRVPVALIGAKLPSGFEISKATIRGIESYGMMCSKKELGLSDEHSGLLILDESVPVGQDIVETLNLDEVIFDISVTANRGDALSHLGIARELSAIFNIPLQREPLDDESGKDSIKNYLELEIEDQVGCPRYGARLVKNVKVGPSPQWMQLRLEKVDMHPINNIVDITNYIQLDIGHPMHAYDYDKLNDKKIIVRRAKQNEALVTLDKATHKLTSENLVIADSKMPVGIAGVMGGLDSSVTAETKNVVLEAASFETTTIRKTAKQTGLHSDSSYRFERGTNIDNIPIALNHAAKLMSEYAEGEPIEGILDMYPRPEILKQIKLRTKRVNKLIGINLNQSQIETLIMRLKLDAKKDGEDLIVNVPPYRHDLEQEADLIEEVARIYGYNNIPETLPNISSILKLPTALQKMEGSLKSHLVSNGFREIITYSFIPQNVDTAFIEKKSVNVVNPLSEDHSIMRTSLKWNMFEAIKRNILNDEYDIRFFEIAHVFHQSTGEINNEPTRLCLGFAGEIDKYNWKSSKAQFDLFTVKGFIQAIASLFRIKLRYAPATKSIFHPSQQIEVLLGKTSIGEFGMIHPKFLDNKKMPKNIFIAELDLNKLSEAMNDSIKAVEIPELPSIKRDLALLVPDNVSHRDISRILTAEGKSLLEECFLFDLYEGKNMPEGKKSLAYSLTFRDKSKTLTDNEVQPLINNMIKKLEDELAVKLR